MKTRHILFSGFILATSSLGAYLLWGSTGGEGSGYMLAQITRGDLESTISSTGTVAPVTQVEVGTQVSGILDRVCVDFNDRVRQGQILAVIDTVVLKLAVTEAEAGYARAEAKCEEAKANFNRALELHAKKMIAASELQTVTTALKTARADVSSAEVARDRARRNLTYAIIRSPINGTVIARNVEAGQTVAASFTTPTLFVIAQDLSQMEIKALVDESDIGEINAGQSVHFTVQAFPSRSFGGRVKQVRVQPSTTANVVHYTVVVSADNSQLLLLPGMTATVEFVVAERKDVLLVPNAALRFQPSEEDLRRLKPPPGGPGPGFGGAMLKPDTSGRARPSAGAAAAPQDVAPRKPVWYMALDGTLAMEMAELGITDGSSTEIKHAGRLAEGMNVIVGNSQIAKKQQQSRSNAQQRPPGPPPF